MATRNEIDLLRLAPRAHTGAVILNERFPATVFTSGLRNISKQATVMARNVMRNPNWVGMTYKKGQELQALLTEGKFKDENTIRLCIFDYLHSKTEEWLAGFSRHFGGYAFDVLPVTDITGIPTADGYKMVEYMRRHLGAEKVLLSEGGRVIWHVQFTPSEEV